MKTAVLDRFFDLTLALLCTARRDGNAFENLNPAWERTLGWTREELCSKSFIEFIHPDDVQPTFDIIAKMDEGAPAIHFENRYRHKNGSWVWLSWVSVLEGGTYYAAAMDVTPYRQTQKQLRAINAELERAREQSEKESRFKSQFLAGMSHELRTPLNAIIGFSELMASGAVGPLSAKQQEYLGDVVSSGRHLLGLINDILDLSKVEAGKTDFRPEPVDPAGVVHDVTSILASLAAQKQIRVTTRVDPTLTSVTLDPARLKQVLYNYLSNAIKFSPAGSEVRVQVAAAGKAMFRLEVEDEGPGIPKEDLPRLFVEFQQLHATASQLSQRQPGTGLGLALTKRIVEAQGGHVGVRSAPGEGSSFFAVLPRETGTVATPAPATPLLIPRADAPVVLVVEDDPGDRDLLVRTLFSAGYAVQGVATGAEALTRLGAQRFDAVTLDLLLPDTIGVDLLRAIRSTAGHENVPVIVVTVVREKGTLEGFGVHDILAKPIVPEELLASLARAGVSPEAKRPILVVDDDETVLKLAEATLVALGYRAICRQSAEAALRDAAADLPAAVVLDLVMPGMDGFAFLTRFRTLAGAARVPVIIWTVKDLTAAERDLLLASAQAVVAKGGGGASLLEELHKQLPGKAGSHGR